MGFVSSTRALVRLSVGVATVAGGLAQTPPPYVLRTVAGTHLIGDGGPAAKALLLQPTATVRDRAGNLFILDNGHTRIRRVAPDGIISTLTTRISGSGMTLDRAGNILVAGSTQIIRVAPDGRQTVIAGKGALASDGDGGPALQANLRPYGIAAAPDGSIYFTESSPIHTVRKIDPSGIVTLVAGRSRTSGFTDNVPAADAQLNAPRGIVLDSAGNIYVADLLNFRIRKITASDGRMTTFAGNGSALEAVDRSVASRSPAGGVDSLTIDSRNVVHFATAGQVSSIAADGIVRVLGKASNAALHVDPENRLWLAERGQRRVVRLESDRRLTNVAGGEPSNGDGGPANLAVLGGAEGIAVGPDGSIYVSDPDNERIRKISANGTISTLARVTIPRHLAVDAAGTLYASRITEVVRFSPTGAATTIAGRGTGDPPDEGAPATAGRLFLLGGLAFDRGNRLHLSQSSGANKVWAIESSGIIRTVAGKKERGFAGDGGPAAEALLNNPNGVCFDAQGNLLIADQLNHRIRRVTHAGRIETLLGSGTATAPAAGAPVSPATPIFSPTSLACGPDGSVYVASLVSIYQLTPAGQVYPVAGGGPLSLDPLLPFPEYGSARFIALSGANVLAVDRNGQLLIANDGLNRVLRLEANPAASLIAEGELTRTAQAGRALTTPLRVRVLGKLVPGPLPVPAHNVPVTFTVVSGEATPAERVVMTDAAGLASLTLTMSSAAGEVVVRASTPGVAETVDFTIAVRGPGVDGNLPEIASVPEVSQYAIVSVSGRYFAPEGTDVTGQLNNNGLLPTRLEGVCVELDGVPARILRVQPHEIVVLAQPISRVETAVQVITDCGGPVPARSAVFRAPVKSRHHGGSFLVRRWATMAAVLFALPLLMRKCPLRRCNQVGWLRSGPLG